MKLAIAFLISIFAVTASAGISKTELQEIVNSFSLVPDESGEGYYAYESTSDAVGNVLTQNQLERIIGRRVKRDEKNLLGEVYAVGSRQEYLINVKYSDGCVDSEIVVSALDHDLKPVAGIQERWDFRDNDTCPD